MRRLCLALLLLPAWASGATYYVDCSAGTGGDGSLATPWDAVADVNAASFSAGDSVLFKRGCTWRETLTVPSSGSAGSPITFGAYGSGEKPIISGADVLSSSGWASSSSSYYGDVWWDNFETNDTSRWTGVTGSPTANATAKNNGTYGLEVNANGEYATKSSITWAGTTLYVRVYVKTVSLTAGGTFVGNRTIKITNGTGGEDIGFDLRSEGAAAVTLVGPVYTWSPVAWSNNVWHYLELKVDTAGKKISSRLDGVAIQTDFDAAAWTGLANYNQIQIGLGLGSDNSYASGSVYFDDVSLNTTGWIGTTTGAAYPSTYQKALATEPQVALENGVGLSPQTSVGAVDSTAGSFHWAANVLYVNAAGANKDPGTNGATYEVGTRNYGINASGRNYVTLRDITAKGANVDGVRAGGTAFVGSGLTLTNNANGFYGIGVAHDETLTDCVAANNKTNGFSFYAEAAAPATLTDCLSYSNGSNGVELNGTPTVTCTRCLAYSNGVASATAGSGFTAHDTAVLNINSSIAWGNGKAGIAVIGTTSGTFYNNTLYNNFGNGQGSWGITVLNAGSGTFTIKNNICANHTNDFAVTDGGFVGTVASDYNDFHMSRVGAKLVWKGTEYASLALFAAASSTDAHSISADPLFVSASDFRLQPNSPAINAGVGVGLLTDFAGMTIWNTPSIGAYEFQDGAPHVPEPLGGTIGLSGGGMGGRSMR